MTAFIASSLLSGGLETLQTYLPSRFASNIDLAANSAGALLGALLGLVAAPWLLREEGLQATRRHLLREGAGTDLGLVLLGLWLFSLFSPETLLFGNGDLRSVFQTPSGKLYPAEVFIRVEAAVAGGNTLAICLLAAALLRGRAGARLFMLAILAAGLLTRSVAYGVLFDAQALWYWLTPGALVGIAVGLLLALVAAGLPRTAQLALAGLALMFAAIVVNIAPENPYLAAFLSQWRQGHFLNFNGLTRLVSALWPFAALAYLISLAGERRYRSVHSEWRAR